MIADALASPATVEASITRVIARPCRSTRPGSTSVICSEVGSSAWSPSLSMQSARAASLSTMAMLSIVPFMRPWTTASRMASGVTVPPTRRSTASLWSSSRASVALTSSSSLVARIERSSRPSACRRVFIWFTGDRI